MPKQIIDINNLQIINIGVTADDGTGDNLRTAFDKVNSNFGMFGYILSEGFLFRNLGDTPEYYVSNALVTVNGDATGLVHRNLVSNDVVVDITQDNINMRLAPVIGNVHTFSEDVFFNKNITVMGNTIVQDTYINVENFETENRVIVANTEPAVSQTTGALRVTGGGGFQGNVHAPWFVGNVAGTVSSLSNHNSDGLQEGANNLYWTTARANANKKYIDDNDYLNFDPLAGVLDENLVPLYSDFKFSLGASGSYSFFLTDDQNFEVVYFHANTPTGNIRPFRAYRFAVSQEFIYDPEPLEVSFAAANEYVKLLMNVGTQFAYIELVNKISSVSRKVLVKTNGSSKSLSWVLVADVTSISAGTTNFFLLVDPTGDRILKTTMSSTSVSLDVYDTGLSLLRSQQLFTSAEVTNTDLAGQGRVVGDTSLSFGYNPFGTAFAFTWNRFTDNLLIKLVGYYVYQTTSGGVVGQSFGSTISWSIPRSWFQSGGGTPTNLIPVKSSGFRYHKLPDATWDTTDGGMGQGYGTGGQGISVTTDEYARRITLSSVGTWSTTGFSINTFANQEYKTIGNNLTSLYSASVGIPDASPWSKLTYASFGQIIDTNILFTAVSNKFGSQTIAANFSNTAFSSIVGANDTLKLDPTSYNFESGTNTSYSTTVRGGVPYSYQIVPGNEVLIITVANGRRVKTGTGFILPAIPGTIGAVTGVVAAGPIVYNANDTDRKFWSFVSSSTGQCYIAEYTTGSWSTIHGPFIQVQIDTGKANRGDSSNNWFASNGTTCLTENGRFLSQFGVSHVGGTAWYQSEFNVNTKVSTVHGDAKFNNPGGAYGGVSGYYGTSFGYSVDFGYYSAEGSATQTSIAIVSSKDVRGVGTTISEDDWYNGTGTRHVIHLSAEPTVGLFVYLKAYPLFIGGYYTVVPELSLPVAPNATNYVYAEKDPVDRTVLNITVSVDYQPSSFSKVVLGEVITDADKVIAATSYPINGGKFSGEWGEIKNKPTLVTDLQIINANLNVTKTDGTTTNLGSVLGPTGPTGPAGPAGTIGVNGAPGPTGASGMALWADFPLNAASPGPNTFTRQNITGFQAYSSTDFPNTYYTGLSVHSNTTGIQIAGGWNVDEATPTAPVDLIFRANDDTGNTATWSDWSRVLVTPVTSILSADQVLYKNSANVIAGSTNLTFDGSLLTVTGNVKLAGGDTTGIIFRDDPGGGGGDRAWIRYFAYSGEQTNLEISTQNDGIGSTQDSINLTSAGGVGINRQSPTAELDVNGAIVASGDITAFSDAKLKTNVRTIANPLAIVRNLRGVDYDRVDTGEAGSGVIAQETLPHMPQLVKDHNGTLSVNYNGFSGVFIESIKALEDQIIELRAEIKKLKGE